MSASDVQGELMLVDPAESTDTWRVLLWAAPGQGKSVAAASAPGPILVLSADRPSAYKFSRKHHGRHWVDRDTGQRVPAGTDGAQEIPGKDIRETRFRDVNSLAEVYRYLSAHPEIQTVIVDPISNVYDQLVDTLPKRADGEPDYQAVNKKVFGFVKSLRAKDINLVIVAHEKLSEGRNGDGKLYPLIGGPKLINQVLGEMDIVAHIERLVRVTEDDEEEHAVWIGQLQPRDNLVCKESTDALGPRRIADLTRWFELASAAYAPDDSDVPFGEGFEPAPAPVPAEDQQTPAAAPAGDPAGSGSATSDEAGEPEPPASQSRPVITAAQIKRLHAVAREKKLTDSRALYALVEWLLAVQSIKAVPAERYDELIDAVGSWRPALGAIVTAASAGDERAQDIYERLLGPQTPES